MQRFLDLQPPARAFSDFSFKSHSNKELAIQSMAIAEIILDAPAVPTATVLGNGGYFDGPMILLARLASWARTSTRTPPIQSEGRSPPASSAEISDLMFAACKALCAISASIRFRNVPTTTSSSSLMTGPYVGPPAVALRHGY